jgi:hypothetical protein
MATLRPLNDLVAANESTESRFMGSALDDSLVSDQLCVPFFEFYDLTAAERGTAHVMVRSRSVNLPAVAA